MSRFFFAPSAVALALGLSGCSFLFAGPDLSGKWEGDMDCEDSSGDELTFDLILDLDDDGGGEFSGPFTFRNEQRIDMGAETMSDLKMEIILDAVIEVSGRGEQDLDISADYDDSRCRVTTGGEEDFDDECTAFGLDDGDLEDLGGNTDMIWDGEDTIEIDDSDCQGEMER